VGWGHGCSESEWTPIEAADAWIAATTLLYDAVLITHNPKDYLGVPNLHVFSCS
jgi:predicted nucleic acid-binding protein